MEAAGGARLNAAALATNARTWDKVGAEWVATERQRLWRRHSDHVWGELISLWMPAGSRTVLKTDLFDEALGDGVYGALARFGAVVHGLDIAPATASSARSRFPSLMAVAADVRRLPFASGSFDAVVSLSTLDHLDTEDDLRAAMHELRRVTATGGRLLLTMDNPSNPKLALRALLQAPLQRTSVVPYFCGVTLPLRQLARLAEETRFRVLETRILLHAPRILSIWTAALLERVHSPALERIYLRSLRTLEALNRLPARMLTGHYTALLAEAAD